MSRCGCATCGELFKSVDAFDKHRVGTYIPDTRRCRGEDELTALGFVKKDNVWRKGLSSNASLGHWVK